MKDLFKLKASKKELIIFSALFVGLVLLYIIVARSAFAYTLPNKVPVPAAPWKAQDLHSGSAMARK